MSEVIKVMLVDDHAVVRMGFRLLLDGTPDVRVVAEAESGEDAIRKLQEVRPDIVVLDLSMPGIGGLEALSRILARDSAIRVLVLTAHEDAMHARRVLKAGARGYLSKRSAPEAMIHAIHQVMQGRTFLEPAIAQELAVQQLTGDRNPVDMLSEKEFKVLLSLAVKYELELHNVQFIRNVHLFIQIQTNKMSKECLLKNFLLFLALYAYRKPPVSGPWANVRKIRT